VSAHTVTDFLAGQFSFPESMQSSSYPARLPNSIRLSAAVGFLAQFLPDHFTHFGLGRSWARTADFG